MTKPSLSRSNGRDARSGSSLRFVIARQAQNPAIPIGLIGASAPPASMATASPRLMISNASPIALAPVEHAETIQWLGPRRSLRIDTMPLAMSAIM